MTWVRRHIHPLTLGVIVLAGLGFRAWGLTWGLWNASVERRPQPDEWVIYWLTHWFGQYHSLNPCPNAARSQCFFDWGAVYPYLAYAVHFPLSGLITHLNMGPVAGAAFVQAAVAGRAMSLGLSVLTIPAVYWLGTRAYGQAAGVVAALLIALSGLLIELAHFATPDSATVLLCTATLTACVIAAQTGSPRALIAAGVLGGLATGSEYHMALLGLPIATSWLISQRGRPGLLAATIGSAIIAFLAVNPYMLVEFSAFWEALLHTLRIRTVDSQLEYGDRFAAYGPAALYIVHYVLGYGMGLAAAVWLGIGAIWAGFKHRKADLVLLAWIIPYGLLISISSTKFLRYGAPLIPPLAVFAARFALDAWRQFRPSLRPAMIAVAGIVIGYSTLYDAAYAGLFTSTEPRAVATDWLRAHVAAGTQIAFQSLPDGVINLPYFVSAAGYRPCFSLYRPARLAGPMQYLLVDSYGLEEHSLFSDNQVSRYFRSLKENRSYRVVAVIHYVPTFLGFRFPLDGSPHDWRYAAHNITIYRHLEAPGGSASYCFRDISHAIAALYVHPKS